MSSVKGRLEFMAYKPDQSVTSWQGAARVDGWGRVWTARLYPTEIEAVAAAVAALRKALDCEHGLVLSNDENVIQDELGNDVKVKVYSCKLCSCERWLEIEDGQDG